MYVSSSIYCRRNAIGANIQQITVVFSRIEICMWHYQLWSWWETDGTFKLDNLRRNKWRNYSQICKRFRKSRRQNAVPWASNREDRILPLRPEEQRGVVTGTSKRELCREGYLTTAVVPGRGLKPMVTLQEGSQWNKCPVPMLFVPLDSCQCFLLHWYPPSPQLPSNHSEGEPVPILLLSFDFCQCHPYTSIGQT